MVYSGRLWPDWAGDHFVGSLKFDYIARLDPDAGWAEEALRSPETARVRDIREAPEARSGYSRSIMARCCGSDRQAEPRQTDSRGVDAAGAPCDPRSR